MLLVRLLVDFSALLPAFFSDVDTQSLLYICKVISRRWSYVWSVFVIKGICWYYTWSLYVIKALGCFDQCYLYVIKAVGSSWQCSRYVIKVRVPLPVDVLCDQKRGSLLPMISICDQSVGFLLRVASQCNQRDGSSYQWPLSVIKAWDSSYQRYL